MVLLFRASLVLLTALLIGCGKDKTPVGEQFRCRLDDGTARYDDFAINIVKETKRTYVRWFASGGSYDYGWKTTISPEKIVIYKPDNLDPTSYTDFKVMRFYPDGKLTIERYFHHTRETSYLHFNCEWTQEDLHWNGLDKS